MNEDQITNLIIEIKTKLSSIETKIDNVNARLENHERRLVKIEDNRVENQSSREDTFKNRMLEFMAKALISALAIAASLCGAGGIIAKFIGG